MDNNEIDELNKVCEMYLKMVVKTIINAKEQDNDKR